VPIEQPLRSEHMKRKGRKKKPSKFRLIKRIAVGAVVLLLIFGFASVIFLKREDRKYEKFLGAGAGINSFLRSFALEVEGAVARGDVAGLMNFYAEDYESPTRGRWELRDEISEHGVIHLWLRIAEESDGSAASFDRNQLREEWTAYLGGIAQVDGASVDGVKVSSDNPDRGLGVVCKINIAEKIVAGESATVTVKYILSGRDKQNRVVQDRFFFRWWLRSTGGDREWEIIRDELLTDPDVTNQRVVSEQAHFDTLDLVAAGITANEDEVYVHQRDPELDPEREDVELKFGVIQHAGGGVTSCDYDGDGWVDLFFSDGVESRLFRNLGATEGTPRFRDVTESAGLAGNNRTHCTLFADFDNDGVKDLFVVRYNAASRVYLGRALILESASGHAAGGIVFEDKSAEFGLDLQEQCVSACCLDFDRDGFVDIYIGVNGDARNELPRIPFFARNGKPNRLYRNVGGTKFVDVTEKAGVGDPGWSLAVACGDLNGDGWTDLVVANDFGRKNLYRNNGDGTFHECAKEAGTLDFSGGMGIAIGDVDGDERMDIYTSNIYSNQRWLGEYKALLHYSRNLLRSKWIFVDFTEYRDLHAITEGNWKAFGKMAGEGNSLFLNRGQDDKHWTFHEARESCTNRAGWGWGVALGDIDNDTDLDIYAANGWITGEKADDL